jgi:hypothetical protein
LPFMSATPGPPKGPTGIQGAARQPMDQSAHTYKPMYAPPANREFRHLNKWRTVDKWLFWAQLPTALIPLVSTIVTVVSFGVQLKLKTSEKNCWVGIGR